MSYATVERLNPTVTAVITRQGSREMFDRARVEASLAAASDYQLGHKETAQLVDRVLDDLYPKGPTVASTEIAETLLRILSRYDYRLYARYALLVVQPESLADFLAWLDKSADEKSASDNTSQSIRVLDEDGVQQDVERQRIVDTIRRQTRVRRDFTPDAAVARMADITMDLIAQLVADRDHPIVTTSELDGAIADALLQEDQLSYFNYAILQKQLDSKAKLAGELRAILDDDARKDSR